MNGTSLRVDARHVALGLAVGAGAWQLWQRVVSMTTLPPFARLISRLAAPEPGMDIYDPSCGAGILLRALADAPSLGQGAGSAPRCRLFGQELDPIAYSMGRIALRRSDAEIVLAQGDTLREPAFVEADRVRTFDVVVANPVWEQRVHPSLYRSDPYARFGYGVPPAEYADWGWTQHCIASMNGSGRLALVVGTGALSRSDEPLGTASERDIRGSIVADDLIETVIWCSPEHGGNDVPPLEAYATRRLAQSALIVFNRRKRNPGRILMIDGTAVVRRERFRPSAAFDAFVELHERASDTDCSLLVTNETVEQHGYDLRPDRYFARR